MNKYLLGVFILVVLGGSIFFAYENYYPQSNRVSNYTKSVTDSSSTLPTPSPQPTPTPSTFKTPAWIAFANMPEPSSAIRVMKDSVSLAIYLAYDNGQYRGQSLSKSDSNYPSAATIKLTAYFKNDVLILPPDGVDFSTFQVTQTRWFGKDASHVYYLSCEGLECLYVLVKGADPATFVQTSDRSAQTNKFTAKDKNHTYTCDFDQCTPDDSPDTGV